MALHTEPPRRTPRPPPERRPARPTRGGSGDAAPAERGRWAKAADGAGRLGTGGRGAAAAAFAIEFAAVIAFLQWFGAARHWVAGGAHEAVEHGWQLVSVERWLHVFVEPHIQSAVTRLPLLERLAGTYYGTLHLMVPAVAALIVRSRSRDWYLVCRRAFVLLAAGALAVFWLWPLAPPRLMPPSLGFVDVLSRDVHLPALDHLFAPSLYNGFAAMPSLHVGFAAWAVIALWPVASPRLRPVLLAHPVLMALATVATGNHFVLDAVGGLVLLGAAFWWQSSARLPLSPRLLPPILAGGAAFIWIPLHAPAIAAEDVVLAVVALAAVRRLQDRPAPESEPAPVLVPAALSED